MPRTAFSRGLSPTPLRAAGDTTGPSALAHKSCLSAPFSSVAPFRVCNLCDTLLIKLRCHAVAASTALPLAPRRLRNDGRSNSGNHPPNYSGSGPITLDSDKHQWGPTTLNMASASRPVELVANGGSV